MIQSDFKTILTKYIYPLLPHFDESQVSIQNIDNTEYTTKYFKYDETKNNLTIYPTKNVPKYVVVIQKICPFELRAAECILNRILAAYNKLIRHTDINGKVDYALAIFQSAYELGICDYLGGSCYYQVIKKLKYWAPRTYEGKRVALALYMQKSVEKKGPNYLEFLMDNYSAVITNPEKLAVIISCDGSFLNYVTFDKNVKTIAKISNKNQFVPNFLEKFSSETYDKVGFVLLNSGDILIINKGRVTFAFRAGNWTFFDTNLIVSQTYNAISKITHCKSKKKNETLSKSICESVIDVAFAHTGGCIGLISERKQFIETYCPIDSLENDTNAILIKGVEQNKANKIELKKSIIKKLVFFDQKRTFSKISRLTREELLAMDGAVCIDLNGSVLCAASIVKVDSGSDAGGRTQAAKTLAKEGGCLGIKISEDGYIECYQFNRENKAAEILFSIK